MKNYVVFTLVFISTACISDKLDSEKYITTDLIDNENPPVMEFEQEIYHFDTSGDKYNMLSDLKIQVAHIYHSSVKQRVGVPFESWPKEPISPGGTGEIQLC